MSRDAVHALIGRPAFEVAINTRYWDSYFRDDFVVHVEYNKAGSITNLYMVDRTRVDVPEHLLENQSKVSVTVTSNTPGQEVTFDAQIFSPNHHTHFRERYEAQQTPFSINVDRQDLVLHFSPGRWCRRNEGESQIISTGKGRATSMGSSVDDVVLMLINDDESSLLVTGL